MSRVLVTGGAGAIGSHLVARLVGDGHDVTVLDDLSSGREELVPTGARLVKGSIVVDDALDAAFANAPELVCHLAALFANQNSVEHPEDDLLVNGLGTLKILDRSRVAGVRKVLACSSSCIYASGDPMVETDPVRSHTTPYAITKGLGEAYAQLYASLHGLDVAIVRPFNAYGPHELPGTYRNVIPNWIALALQGRPLRITGSGAETRDFTFVGDIVDGMAGALEAPTTPGAVFNLASGHETSIADLAGLILDLTGSRSAIEHVERREWDTTPRRVASIAAAGAAFGYRPAVALEDGLRRTIDWLRPRLG